MYLTMQVKSIEKQSKTENFSTTNKNNRKIKKRGTGVERVKQLNKHSSRTESMWSTFWFVKNKKEIGKCEKERELK